MKTGAMALWRTIRTMGLKARNPITQVLISGMAATATPAAK